MAQTTRVSGEDLTITIGTVTGLTPQGAWTYTATPRYADARGGGDTGPVDKVIGLDSWSFSGNIVTTAPATLIALDGTETTIAGLLGTVTQVSGSAILEIGATIDPAGMYLVTVTGKGQSVPATPSLSGL